VAATESPGIPEGPGSPSRRRLETDQLVDHPVDGLSPERRGATKDALQLGGDCSSAGTATRRKAAFCSSQPLVRIVRPSPAPLLRVGRPDRDSRPSRDNLETNRTWGPRLRHVDPGPPHSALRVIGKPGPEPAKYSTGPAD
jgi:hypothetical protein